MEIKFSDIEEFLKNVEKINIVIDGEKDTITVTSVLYKSGEMEENVEDPYTCQYCGEKKLTKQGYRKDVEGKTYSRVRCSACGKWGRSYAI